MLILNALSDAVSHMFHWILLWLDGVVYWAASKCYQLFMMLASTRIFEDEFFANFARRIYAILGVFMLFYLAYALLNAIVDPDKYSKGDKGVGNIAINFVISLVLLGLVPTIFSYAYRLQNFVLSKDLMGTIILGAPLNDVQSSNVSFGDSVSFTVLNTFINPGNVNVNMGKQGGYSWWNCKKEILENSDYSCLTGLAYPYVYQNTNDSVKYYGIISTLVGAYLVYILLSFTLDLGVRVIKLAFYQLIAPIPIIMRALPSKKDSFNKWLKKTISTYADVFVRVGFMYMSVYFISRIIANNDLAKYLQSGPTGLLVLCVIIMGIFTFAKQISKEISDILGVNSDIKFNIRDKLKASGPLGNLVNDAAGRTLGTVTGAAGGAWTSFANGQNFVHGAFYGGISGWNKKGFQFNKQRQELYEKFGGKGKAGWFGGRGFLNRIAADTQDHAIDDYKDTVLPFKIRTFEEKDYFQQLFKNQIKKRRLEVETEIGLHDKEITVIKEQEKKAKSSWEANRNEVVNELKQKLDVAKNSNEREILLRRIAELENQEFDSSEYKSRIQSVNNEANKLRELLDENAPKVKDDITGNMYTQIELDALGEARKEARDKHVSYAADLGARERRVVEKEAKKRANSVEGQTWVNIQDQANKRGGPPPIGGAPAPGTDKPGGGTGPGGSGGKK